MQFLRQKGYIHFIGIGGVGMQTLAGILLEKYPGEAVISGSDLERSERTEKLKSLGVEIFYGHNKSNLPTWCDLVVYSSAVKEDNPEYAEAKKRGFCVVRRGELLAALATTYDKVAIVSGSHGKTSTCATLVHLLKKQGVDCGYLIGGELFNGNSFAAGDGRIFVTEADESDGTHVLFKPDVNIVVNLDDDHAWSVGGEEQLKQNFLASARKSKKILYLKDEIKDNIFRRFKKAEGYSPEDIRKLNYPSNIIGYQKKNSFLALKALEALGMEVKTEDLADFCNVKRRMTTICKKENFVLLEDYAHHPKELQSSLELLREKYADYRLTVIFQVHRVARMNKYFNDFAEILGKMADRVILSRIFEAWVSGESNYTPQNLADKLANGSYMEDFEDIKKEIMQISESSTKELVAIIGAGDIHNIIAELKL